MDTMLQTASQAFMPHGMCYLWEPSLLWLHVISDLLIGAAYFAIPPALVYLVLRARREVGADPNTGRTGIPHEKMVLAFGVFIVACGITHLIAIYTVWVPAYWLSGSAKALTAGVSLATAAALPPLVPRAVDLLREARASEERRVELEAALAELSEARRQLRASEIAPILEATPVGMVAVKPDGRIAAANLAAGEIFGYESSAMLGTPVEALMPAEVAREHPELRRRFAAAPERRSMGVGRDLRGVRRDGSEIPIEIGLSPLATEEGPLVLASIIDITVRKQAELEMARSNDALQEFVHAASHDLKEPLRSVANFAELLSERYEGAIDERADRYISFIVGEAHRMNALIEDLLAYSLAGRERRRNEAVDLGGVVRDVTSEFSERLAEQGGTIETGELPVLTGDRVELSLILRNLIANAIRYRGEDPPRIRVEAARGEAGWTVSVADNGIGIPEDAYDRIFRIYQRLHRDGTGTGLGLALCQRVVHALGGEIWVESVVGEGSVFRFTVPDA